MLTGEWGLTGKWGRLALAQTECQSSVMTEPPAAAEAAPAYALGPWRELRSGVYVAVAEPESVNLGLVVGSQGALLVDTGSSPTQGRVLRASVAAVTDVPVTPWSSPTGITTTPTGWPPSTT